MRMKLYFLLKPAVEKRLKKWVLGFGSEAELLKPIGLRKEIIEEINAMLKNY